MNRADFFKRLGIGALAVVVAPKVLAEVKDGLPKGTLLHEDGTVVTPDELKMSADGWHVPTKHDQELIDLYLMREKQHIAQVNIPAHILFGDIKAI